MFPAFRAPWGLTDCLAAKMFEGGMRGVFSFDVAVGIKDDSRYNYQIMACSPRCNESTYSSSIANALGAKAWLTKKVATKMTSFESLDLGDLEYDFRRKSGIVVVNWGCIEEGKIVVLLIAPTHDEQLKLEESLRKIVQ